MQEMQPRDYPEGISKGFPYKSRPPLKNQLNTMLCSRTASALRGRAAAIQKLNIIY